MKEVKQFQAESKELLDLMINSIYSNQEIFLRELISNASDAIDKYQYLSISSEGKFESKPGEIFLNLNKEKRIIEIKDNGIGMDQKSLEENLGTIAKSGSKDFVSKMKDAKEKDKLNIIGQFGVGFYSAFMVADKIEVLTKEFKKSAFKFTSTGKDSYTIEDTKCDELGNSGTIVRIYLKPSTKEADYDTYLEEYTIKDLVSKYSDYVRYPIKMEVIKHIHEKDKDGKEIPDKHHDEKVVETLNSMIPLWKKQKKDIKEKDLNEFYKNKFMDYEDPMVSLPINVDGLISYNSLVFIPSHAPYDLYSENYEKGLDLYAKGIFIQSKCKDLIPDYLKFVKGLVDSNDFSLNISREILQQSPILKKISDNVENKIISKLKDMLKKERDKYETFFKNYGDFIKYGIYESYGSKNELLGDLLMFYSMNEKKHVTLQEYKDKMKKNQKFIFFGSGKSIDAIKILPQIEKYKKDKIDVLLCDSRIDEFCLMMMKNYDKVDFKNISEDKAENISKAEEENIKNLTADNKRLLDNLTEALKDKIDSVIISSKLVDSPVCISSKEGISTNMENVLKEEPGSKNTPKARKVLELNPTHPIFEYLSKIQSKDDEVKNYASILFDEALLLEGSEVQDKSEFIKKINDLMVKALSK